MIDLTRYLLRAQVTRGRLAAVAVLGAVLVLLGVAILVGDGAAAASLRLVERGGFGLALPVVAVVIATAILGDAAEDGTLGYLVVTPQPRWRIAVPGLLAAGTAVVPLAVVPLVVVAGINGVSARTLGALVLAASAGALAYASLFLALGVRFSRALVVGLAYSALWEGVIAGLSSSLARLSIRSYVLSLFAALRGAPAPEFGVGGITAAVVLTGIVAGGLGLTTLLVRTWQARA